MFRWITTARDRANLRAAQEHLAAASLSLWKAANCLDDIRLAAEVRTATAGLDWEEGAAGCEHAKVMDELRAEALAWRTTRLPDISRLR